MEEGGGASAADEEEGGREVEVLPSRGEMDGRADEGEEPVAGRRGRGQLVGVGGATEVK